MSHAQTEAFAADSCPGSGNRECSVAILWGSGLLCMLFSLFLSLSRL